MRLTVLFDGQFWVGVVETEKDGAIQAMEQVFDAEPQDAASSPGTMVRWYT